MQNWTYCLLRYHSRDILKEQKKNLCTKITMIYGIGYCGSLSTNYDILSLIRAIEILNNKEYKN